MRVVVVAAALVASVASRAPQRETADLIVHGATIHTMEPGQPLAEAFAVRGARFVAVGTTRDVLHWRGPDTRVVDASGRTIVPGLQDAHGHVLGLGRSLQEIDLRGTTSFAAIADLVRGRARAAADGEWILGRGWDQNDWAIKDWPTAAPLDAAAPHNPVFLTRIDGHAAIASRAALAAAGLSRATPDPDGGRIIRDADGTPTGVLIDRAQRLVSEKIPPPTRARLIEALVRADRELGRVGLTMVHDAGVAPDVVALYQQLVAENRIATRLYVMLTGEQTADWFTRGPLLDPQHRLTVRAVKLVADGALGSRGAALLEDYADEPGNRGLLVTPPAVLYERARAAVEAGFQPAIHAIGDRANREVMDVFARVQREVPRARALRLRSEHAQILDAAEIPRFAALGVVASMQAVHCTSDMPWAPDRLGAERIGEGAYVWRALLDAGAAIANGSDFPVELPDPLLGIHAAVTRQDPSGHPPGGWNPAQRLTREEALRSFTLAAAWAAHAEDDLGSIGAGKLADFVVLSRDIMKVPTLEIPRTAILRTVVGGRTVYDAAGQ